MLSYCSDHHVACTAYCVACLNLYEYFYWHLFEHGWMWSEWNMFDTFAHSKTYVFRLSVHIFGCSHIYPSLVHGVKCTILLINVVPGIDQTTTVVIINAILVNLVLRSEIIVVIKSRSCSRCWVIRNSQIKKLGPITFFFSAPKATYHCRCYKNHQSICIHVRTTSAVGMYVHCSPPGNHCLP